MKTSCFESEVWLPKPPDSIFQFFADPHNLELITPPWLHFEILTKEPIVMKKGTLIDYRLRLKGISMLWRTQIDLWEPPYRFIDLQIKGPYRLWRHVHYLMLSYAGTRCLDQVQYAVPGGRLIDRWLVRPEVEKIFDFRRKKLLELFSA